MVLKFGWLLGGRQWQSWVWGPIGVPVDFISAAAVEENDDDDGVTVIAELLGELTIS